MNRKCYAILTIVMVLPFVPEAARGENPTTGSRSALSVTGLSDYLPPELIPIPGIMRPIRQVTMASPMEGMLMVVHVREGQRVSAGDVLATIDDRVSQAAVNVAQAVADRTADLRNACEELKFSESLLERLLALKSANGGSDFELLEARTRVEQAQAAVASEEEGQRQAKRQLELEQARLEAHNIRAPFNGQVVRIFAYEGTTLTRDDQLLTIIRLDQLEAELHIPLDLHSQLEVGRSYGLIAGPPLNGRLQARLVFMAPLVDSATQTFRCVFTLDNLDQKLPAGFTVQLDMPSLTRSGSEATVSHDVSPTTGTRWSPDFNTE